MRKITLEMFAGLAGLGLVLALPCFCLAQGFSSEELERGVRPGASVPYDGAPFSQRYNDFGPIFYHGFDANSFAYLEYLDRLDRQRKFGYLWPSSKCGSDYQVEQIDRDYWTNSYGRYGSGWRLFRR